VRSQKYTGLTDCQCSSSDDPKGREKDPHQKYRLMPESGLKLFQIITIQPRCSGFVVRCDSESERDTMNPVIDSLVKGRVAGAGVNGHLCMLGGWIRLSVQFSCWRCEM